MAERNYQPPLREQDQTPRGGAQEAPRGGVTAPDGIRKDASSPGDLTTPSGEPARTSR